MSCTSLTLLALGRPTSPDAFLMRLNTNALDIVWGNPYRKPAEGRPFSLDTDTFSMAGHVSFYEPWPGFPDKMHAEAFTMNYGDLRVYGEIIFHSIENGSSRDSESIPGANLDSAVEEENLGAQFLELNEL